MKLRFYDNQTNSPYEGSKILLTHANQNITAITDSNGEAEATFNFSKNSPVVFAEFKTDLKTKSAKAQIAIPTEPPFSLSDAFYILILLLALYLGYKFLKGRVFLLLLFCAPLFAQSVNIAVTQSACNSSGDLVATIQNLPTCIVESFFSFIFNGLIIAIRTFMNATFSLILAIPDAHWFCGPYAAVMGIIESLYTILLMGLGLFYIIRSTDVEGRMLAKKWLKNIFLMVIALTFSFQIFQMVLDINQSIASNLLSQASTNFFSVQTTFSDFVFAIVVLVGFVSAAVLTFGTLLIRYLMLPFLLLLFPFSLFFYFMPISEGFGRFMLKLTLLIVFMTSVDALIILGFFSLFSTSDPTLADPFIRAMASMAALGAVGLVNIAIYLISLLMAIQQGLKLASDAISQVVRIAVLAAVL